MQILKNADVYKRIVAVVGADFNTTHPRFVHDWIDDITEKRLNDFKFRMSGIEKPHVKHSGPLDLGEHAYRPARNIGRCGSAVSRVDFCERRPLRACKSRAEAEESGRFRS